MPLFIDGVAHDPITTAERDALVNPPEGLTIYNSTTGRLETNDGTPSVPEWTASSNINPGDIGAEPAFTKNTAFNKNFGTGANEVLEGSLKGDNNGLAELDGGGKVPTSQLPLEIMEYKGNWDASTNTPTLANTDTGAQGNTYKTSVAGTVDFGAGPITFAIGDWVINNGTIWEKNDNTDAVTSVNTKIGAVVLDTSDIDDTLNKRYVTDADLTTLSNTSGTNSGDNVNATESIIGLGEIGTQAEVNANADDFRWITPLKLFNKLWTRLKFNIGIAKPTHEEGLFYYDKDEHAFVGYNDEADITQQLGREFYRRIRNESGATILNGKVVHQSGAETGGEGRALIGLAQADALATSNVVGVATHDIENNTYGYVTVLGDVNDVDTSSFTVGDILYLSPTVAGGLTSTRPAANEYLVEVATAEIINATTGRLNVNINNIGLLAVGGIGITGWNSGLLVTEDDAGPNGTVDYTSGDYYHEGTLYSITAGNYDLSALYLASLTDGQKAYVALHVDESGVIESSLGTPVSSSSSVNFAPVPAGDVCIAQVLIHRSSGTIQDIKNKVIIDCRNSASQNAIDELVRVSFNDTTQKYLEDALSNNGNVTFTTENDGANETIKGDVSTFTGAGTAGVVPDPTTATGKFLKDDGTWAAPAGGGGTTYTEKYEASTASPSIINTWQTRTIPGATANTIVQILIERSGTHVFGIREVGSSLSRTMTGRDSLIMTTVTDGSGQIQIYADDISTTFRLMGEFS